MAAGEVKGPLEARIAQFQAALDRFQHSNRALRIQGTATKHWRAAHVWEAGSSVLQICKLCHINLVTVLAEAMHGVTLPPFTPPSSFTTIKR